MYPEAHGMVIGAPLAGRSLVFIAALFFDLVSVHAMTLFLDCLACLLGRGFSWLSSIDRMSLSLHDPCCRLVC